MVISPSLTSYFCILKTEIQIDTKIIIRGEIMNKQHLIALDLDGTINRQQNNFHSNETYNCKSKGTGTYCRYFNRTSIPC